MFSKFFNTIFATIIATLTLAQSAFAQPITAPKGKVLVVLSGIDYVALKSGAQHPTGFFLSELMIPAMKLIQAGYKLEFANPSGFAPVMDKVSDDPKWFSSPAEYAQAKVLLNRLTGLRAPQPLATISVRQLETYAGVFLPGGHAPMQDLYRDRNLGRILTYFHRVGKTTALICHAPIALLSAGYVSQPWIYKGYRMTVFSNAEEQQEETNGALGGQLNYYVADALARAGAVVHVNAPWTSDVVQDRELITGQNPMSGETFAQTLVNALNRRR